MAVGLDLIELERIRAALRKQPERFTQRVFHPEELEQLNGRVDKVPGLAGRFAVKEAFQKVWPTSFGWKDVWVVKNGAKPELRYCKTIADLMEQQHMRAHVSITHARDHAAAVVVLERTE